MKRDEMTLTIDSTDLDFIERISECEFSDDLKSCLLHIFGKGGVRERVHDNQREALRTCKRRGCYDGCGICAPYREEPLIIQIAIMVDAYLAGNLDLPTGEIIIPEIEPCPYF